MKTNFLKKNILPSHNFAEKLFAYCMLGGVFIWLITYSSIVSLSWIYSFQEIVNWKVSKGSFLQGDSIKYDIPFRYENYQLARLLSIILWGIVLSLTVAFFYCKKTVFIELHKCFLLIIEQIKKSRQAYRNLQQYERALLVSILFFSVGLRIYLYFYLPPHFDELGTYFQFVDQGFLFINVFYPYPNNHVFFNHVYLLASLFTDDAILAGRLPSMIFFHALIVLLFIGILRLTKNVYAAFLSLIICVFYLPSSVYAVEGRGYMLLSLLLLVAAFSLLLALLNNRKEAFYIFIPASVLAAFTIPVFFVPFLGLMIFGVVYSLMLRKQNLFNSIIMSGICVGLGVLLSYLPIFLFNGIKAVAANETVASLHVPHFYTYNFPIATAETISFLVGTSTKGWIFFVVFGILIGLAIFKVNIKTKLWWYLSGSILSALFFYALVRRSFVLERSTSYNSFFIYSSFAIAIAYWLMRLVKSRRFIWSIMTILTAMIVYSSYFQYQYNLYEPHLLPCEYYIKTNKNINEVVKEHKTIFMDGDSLQTYPMLYYKYMITKSGLPSLEQDNYQEADVLILNVIRVERGIYDLQNYTRTDSIANIPAWSNTSRMVFHRKDKL
ncbi:hypothetical protein WJR50_24575 [Catalinimonas sp. 4WD22]|uniref:hypothetical protein n=1 Tax=Catalinimonas locisalis TaxID=3133978 RepID=UPI003100D05B